MITHPCTLNAVVAGVIQGVKTESEAGLSFLITLFMSGNCHSVLNV